MAKNTLLKLSFKNLGYKTEALTESLTGPTATLFSYEDEIEPIKILYEFYQGNDLPKIKLGLFNNQLLAKEKVIDLAKLPTKNVLQAKLVRVINSPIYSFVYVLKANLQGLMTVLNHLRQKGGGENND